MKNVLLFPNDITLELTYFMDAEIDFQMDLF